MKNRKESRILWKIWNLHEEANRLLWDLYEEEFFQLHREEEWMKYLRWREEHCKNEHANGDEDKPFRRTEHANTADVQKNMAG